MTKDDRNQYLLSISAVAMSTLALAFAFLELRSSERQLDANVWPYVELGVSITPDSAIIEITNKGLGPASVQEFYIMLDGERIENPIDLLDEITLEETVGLSMSSIPGSVLAVGESLGAIEFTATGVGFSLLETFQSMEINVCYCSINNRCWRDNNKNMRSAFPVDQCEPNEQFVIQNFLDMIESQSEQTLQTDTEQ